MDKQQERGEQVLCDMAESAVAIFPEATDEQKEQASRNAAQISAEMDEYPMLYEIAAEMRRMFSVTAEEIMVRHLRNGGGFIPRHVLTLMVYEIWDGIEIPADEEAAWQLARELVRRNWERIEKFLQQKDAVERISNLNDLLQRR